MSGYDEQQDIDGIDTAIENLNTAIKSLQRVRAHEVQESKEYDDDDKGDSDEETPVEDQPKTMRDARIRVREHYRRARRGSSE
jgi:hypothetical protein